jgi:hypothetical protein
MNPTGRALPNAPAVSGETEIVGLAYDLRTLRIFVEDDAGTSFAVEFSDSIGFRVLDERDLMDFWPTFSTPAGWAFEVTSGGWHDLESQRRGGYLVPDVQPGAREFLITGCNDCVSIVALSEPTFQTGEQNKSCRTNRP